MARGALGAGRIVVEGIRGLRGRRVGIGVVLGRLLGRDLLAAGLHEANDVAVGLAAVRQSQESATSSRAVRLEAQVHDAGLQLRLHRLDSVDLVDVEQLRAALGLLDAQQNGVTLAVHRERSVDSLDRIGQDVIGDGLPEGQLAAVGLGQVELGAGQELDQVSGECVANNVLFHGKTSL